MSDSEIIQLFYLRSENAIKELQKTYENYCYKIAQNILSNHEDVNECLNDAYLKLWNTIPPQKPQSLLAYLGKVVRNISLDRYRHLSAKKRGGLEIKCVLDELNDCISSSTNLEQSYELKEFKDELNRFLHKLSKEKRTIFVLRYYYTEKISFIADKYGMSESKVKSILFRVRKQLKQHLEKEGILL